jgi:hypothetical protein
MALLAAEEALLEAVRARPAARLTARRKVLLTRLFVDRCFIERLFECLRDL